ncbi:pyridoxal phosphate-dependent decarboxylase family protein [Aquirhabdus sp.]|uniref:pyridoxal phosphate-dependent decarboxylase family protein n=1 Tax=Aquirhabdus sp. TaxID=2824160 RepID=UPI00396C667E
MSYQLFAESVPSPDFSILLSQHQEAVSAYSALMHSTTEMVGEWLQHGRMYSGLSIEQLKREISLQVTSQGLGTSQAIQHAVDNYLQHSLQVHHPHCTAHLHCPTLVISQVAEVLLNASNQSMDSWDQSPSATIMEIKLIEWLRQQVGYPSGDAGVFTSGGTQSNLMGLMLARDAVVLRRWGLSVQFDGLPPDASRIKVLCSANAHFSVQKNMALLGLGYNAVIPIAVDDQGRMDIDALEQTIQMASQNHHIISAIVATAGTTDAGAIDPLVEIARIAERHQIWLHVDAAWGGALLLSEQYRYLLQGLESADSITLDFHKHFFQPISCGAFLLKDPKSYQLMHYEADYLNSDFDEAQGVPNLVSKSLQTTRRFDALKLWMSLEALGTKIYAALIDHVLILAKQVAALIEADPKLQLFMQPQLSSVLFRLKPVGMSAQALDHLNQKTADQLLASGQANVGVTRYQGHLSLKFTFLNPNTSLADIEQLLKKLHRQAEPLIQHQLEAQA